MPLTKATSWPQAGEAFRSIGIVELEKAGDATITISNKGSDGFAIIDALQLLPLEK